MTTQLNKVAPPNNSTAMFSGYDDILTVPDLARMLNVGRNTAYEIVRAGIIPSVIIGRQVRISKYSVIDYINCKSLKVLSRGRAYGKMDLTIP